MPTEEVEQKISVYDPGLDAYREVPVAQARKFLASAEKLRAKFEELGLPVEEPQE